MHLSTETDLNAVAQDKPAPNLYEERFAASNTNPAPITPVPGSTDNPSSAVEKRHRPRMLLIPARHQFAITAVANASGLRSAKPPASTSVRPLLADTSFVRLAFIETNLPTAHRPQHSHCSRHTHGRARDVNVSGSRTCVNSEANSTTSAQHKRRPQCLGQCEGAFGADVVPIEVQLFQRRVGLVNLSCFASQCHWSNTCRQRCESNDFSCAAVASTSCYARSATSSAKLYHSADASNLDASAILYHPIFCTFLCNVPNGITLSCPVSFCGGVITN